MKSLVLNLVFITGYACCVVAGFLVATPIGLLALGVPMIAIAIYEQTKVVANDS
jgi:hypothetical protein